MRSEDVRDALDSAYTRASAARSEGGHAVAALLSHSVDDTIERLLADALVELGRDHAGVAVAAVGGYGRGELAPHSDIDLLVTHKGWPPEDVEELTRLLLYPLWDSGRQIGHRVRDVRDTLRMLDRVDEAAAALDARLVAGDRVLFGELEVAILEQMRRGRARFFHDLAEETRARHERFGHAGRLLEPDLRDAAGGLRDAHTLGWASRLMPGGGLVALGYLSDADRETVGLAAEFLFDVRVHLHLRSGRHQDRLVLQDQPAVADAMRYEDLDGLGAADRLMRDVYRHTRAMHAIVSSVWDRVLRSGAGRRRFRRERHVSGDGWTIRDGHLEVVAVTTPQQDAGGWLRMFTESVARGAPLGRSSLGRLRTLTDKPASWTPAARHEFATLLSAGRDGVRALEAMSDAGLLEALIPEWEAVRCCPQRNPYHRFSVDVHLLETVGVLAESRSDAAADVADAWSHVADPERLLLAGMTHDIGKGRGGDHAAIGESLASRIAERVGLSADAAADVAFLVREHLTLADLATRRDLGDERTATEVAARAGRPERLAMLYLLTRADALATGSEAWSRMRAALVRELYAKAMKVIEAGPERIAEAEELGARKRAELARATGFAAGEVDRMVGLLGLPWLLATDPAAAARQLDLTRDPLAGGEVRVLFTAGTDADELIVVARDRPGLFATVTGALAARGVDVHGADVWTRADGVAIDVFRVSARGEVWDRVRTDVERALDGRLDVDAALQEKAAHALAKPGAQLPIETRVVVDNAASDFYTVVEVHTADAHGVLRTIAKALTDAGCDLRLAKVATYGAEVVDVFYVRDLLGRKIEEPSAIAGIERGITEVIGS